MRTGTSQTRLIILRGNSATGKSATAAGIRSRCLPHRVAIVGQDYLRRTVLKEPDKPHGASIGLIEAVARYCLDQSLDTIVEGILYSDHYGAMLAALTADHAGTTTCCYFDIPFSETLRRHATKQQAAEYGETEMATWYRERDLLPDGREEVITAEMSLDDIIKHIIRLSGLGVSVAAPRAN
ncbi:MAG TPA: kinase [Streptosporangiaceae bacterium]|nr:kinase [Streptosporangiaceae bacterium]